MGGPCYHGAMSQPAHVAHAAAEDAPQAEPETMEPHAWEGDDDHVIFWMLSLTPTQRLEVAQEFVDGVMMLRNGLRP